MNNIIEIIKSELSSLDYKILDIINESELHRNHSGYSNGQTHFKLFIVSNHFTKMSRMGRHKTIYKLLKNSVMNKIHALSITAYTEEEYDLSEFKNKLNQLL